MAKVTIIIVLYNHRRFIEPVFEGISAQTYKDVHVVAVISGNNDGGKEILQEKFPQVEIIDPGYNIGFAAGHNMIFEKFDSEFFQLVNPDLILKTNYVEETLKAFADPKVGAATGKLYQFKDLKFKVEDFWENKTLDTTGVIILKSGRGRDRGQHELDRGQYDNQPSVLAVSGAGPMYRRSALQAVKVPKSVQRTAYSGQILHPQPLPTGQAGSTLNPSFEYFDEDFHSYWEDVDLGWRMTNAGWKCVFVPTAVGYHGRGAGSSEKGYANVAGFIKHHKTLSLRVKQLNYKNHVFMYIKNSKWFYPQFFIRELFMFVYILIFETATLKILPEYFRQLPGMWKKRKLIKQIG